MTMTMIIVMIMNIYINVENTKLLAQEPNKSGLINQLLTEHYKKINRLPDGKKTIQIESTPPGPNAFHKLTTDKVSSSVRPDIPKADDLKWVEVDTPDCCKQKKPCKHWQWDGNTLKWVNSISGEVKEIE